ncbi:MAG: hypothetical protein BGN92_01655 [Sphingobacteriales bacterium 41-5]|nr:MAG: hypothetical protein BGN92_01655 [Sphingobacteriales bacterium 41-5]
MKDNAVFHVTKVLVGRTKKKNVAGVLKKQYITVGVKHNGIEQERLKLRRITYKARWVRCSIYLQQF